MIVSDALTGVDMTALQDSIAAAAGIDTTRGDVVSVAQMPFDTTTATKAQEALAAADEQAKAERTTELIKTGAIAGVVLVSLVLLIILGRRRGRQRRARVDRPGRPRAARGREGRGPRRRPARRAPCRRPLVPDSKRDDVLAMAAEQPAEVAEVLRGWLTAGRS